MKTLRTNIILILTLSITVGATLPAFSQQVEGYSASTPDEKNNINLELNEQDKPSFKINQPLKKLEGKLYADSEEEVKKAFEIQKKKDIEDIKVLWESTVSRNSVIKFALKKLALPPEQRRVHSSLMARTVSTLISGASILPGIFGLDTVTSTASAVGGKLANRVIANKTKPKELPITDTELIQLAGLVEDLQDKLIKNYYDYKSSIEALKTSRKKLLIQNRNYSEAIETKNEVAIIVASALYDKQKLEEMELKEKAKLHRINLERLAGKEIVDKLNLLKLNSFECAGDIPSEDCSSETKKSNKLSSLEVINE